MAALLINGEKVGVFEQIHEAYEEMALLLWEYAPSELKVVIY